MARPRTGPRKLGPTRTRRLIRDLVAAEHDLFELARRHRLLPDDLAVWVSDAANQQTLAGLCMLADLQTQVLLSRYRLLAAGRLIRLATAEEADPSSSANDTARRACVDLLKMGLKRASPVAAPVGSDARTDAQVSWSDLDDELAIDPAPWPDDAPWAAETGVPGVPGVSGASGVAEGIPGEKPAEGSGEESGIRTQEPTSTAEEPSAGQPGHPRGPIGGNGPSGGGSGRIVRPRMGQKQSKNGNLHAGELRRWLYGSASRAKQKRNTLDPVEHAEWGST
jgi:hypothetical protein